ncbi:hypothetical protein B0H10DRAFT_1959499 [Mycena sp. CBHHK59/15]|nr:hypothetical protein B0H10DRAFT_1959499 [Mycena sp. CBHHK59/15]
MAANSSFLKNSPVIVPPVASAKVLLTEQELTDYVNSEEYMDGDVTDSSDEGFSVKYNTSGSLGWSPQTTSSASSIGQVSSYSTNLSPSSSLDSISSMPTGSVNSSPTRQRPSPHKSDGRAVAYFSALVAEMRGSPNHTFVLNIYNNHKARLYKTHPEQHPVHQSPLSDMLLPYHPALRNKILLWTKFPSLSFDPTLLMPGFLHPKSSEHSSGPSIRGVALQNWRPSRHLGCNHHRLTKLTAMREGSVRTLVKGR